MTAKSPYARLVAVWVALLALLAITCASAYVPMGLWNTVSSFGIAAAKALLVTSFFMHLFSGPGVYRVVVLAAAFVLALLLSLTAADYAARVRNSAPWQGAFERKGSTYDPAVRLGRAARSYETWTNSDPGVMRVHDRQTCETGESIHRQHPLLRARAPDGARAEDRGGLSSLHG